MRTSHKTPEIYIIANKPNGTLYIDVPEEMGSGMKDSVDSRKKPPCGSL